MEEMVSIQLGGSLHEQFYLDGSMNEMFTSMQGRHVQISASFFLFDQDGAIREIALARCTLLGIKTTKVLLCSPVLTGPFVGDRLIFSRLC